MDPRTKSPFDLNEDRFPFLKRLAEQLSRDFLLEHPLRKPDPFIECDRIAAHCDQKAQQRRQPRKRNKKKERDREDQRDQRP